MEEEQKTLAGELDKELAQIPNMPLDDVPDGADAGGNVEHHVVGEKRDYAFKPKQHFELGEALGQMDFELAAEIVRRALCRFAKRLGAHGARARSIHARCAHEQGAWIHGSKSTHSCA